MRVPLGALWATARWIAGHGPDVVVEEPPDLVEATVQLLTGTLVSVRAQAGPRSVGVTDGEDGGPAFDELGEVSP